MPDGVKQDSNFVPLFSPMLWVDVCNAHIVKALVKLIGTSTGKSE